MWQNNTGLGINKSSHNHAFSFPPQGRLSTGGGNHTMVWSGETACSAGLSPCLAILLRVPGQFLKPHVFLLENCGQQEEELKASTTSPENFSTSVSPNLCVSSPSSPPGDHHHRDGPVGVRFLMGPRPWSCPWTETEMVSRAESGTERGDCGAKGRVCITMGDQLQGPKELPKWGDLPAHKTRDGKPKDRWAGWWVKQASDCLQYFNAPYLPWPIGESPKWKRVVWR